MVLRRPYNAANVNLRTLFLGKLLLCLTAEGRLR